MIHIVMGVSGSGKSTIGSLLARTLACEFLDADDLHPPVNLEKLRHGIPLTDDDRRPWLELVHRRLTEAATRGHELVVACSALKAEYREFLSAGLPVTWIFLTGPEALIRRRLERRAGHFVHPRLLRSQLETLEPPGDAIVFDVTRPPAAIVDALARELAHRRGREAVRTADRR